MPGIWPEETSRTRTPPSLFISLDIFLFCREAWDFCPLLSHTGVFLGTVLVDFPLGELTTYGSRAWASFPLVPYIINFPGKELPIQ